MSGIDGLAWLLTYLIHSTALLGAVWVVTRLGWPRSVALREGLWRAALVGGLVSASLQVHAGARLVGPTLPLPELAAQIQSPAPAQLERRAPARPRAATRTTVQLGDRPVPQLTAAPVHAAPPSTARRAAQLAGQLTPYAPALGLLGAGLWFLLLHWRTRRALGARRPITSGPLYDELDGLLRASGVRRRVRLSRSARLRSPVALGALTPEICVPDRMVEDLDPKLARPALAHELGHHARFDPCWLGLAHALRGLCFLQPLNRVAGRELTHLAELGADDWAARHTGDPVSLARCLTEVAGWLRGEAQAPATCPMVRTGGRLEARVARLLFDEGASDAPGNPRVIGATLVAATTLVFPGWSLPASPLQELTPAAARPASPSPRARTAAAAAEQALALRERVDALHQRLAPLESEAALPLLERARQLRSELEDVHSLAARAAVDAPTPSEDPETED